MQHPVQVKIVRRKITPQRKNTRQTNCYNKSSGHKLIALNEDHLLKSRTDTRPHDISKAVSPVSPPFFHSESSVSSHDSDEDVATESASEPYSLQQNDLVSSSANSFAFNCFFYEMYETYRRSY